MKKLPKTNLTLTNSCPKHWGIYSILLLVLVGFPFFTSLAAFILGIIGLKQIKEGKGTGEAFAIVGIILGILGVLLFWALVFLLLLFLGAI